MCYQVWLCAQLGKCISFLDFLSLSSACSANTSGAKCALLRRSHISFLFDVNLVRLGGLEYRVTTAESTITITSLQSPNPDQIHIEKN